MVAETSRERRNFDRPRNGKKGRKPSSETAFRRFRQKTRSNEAGGAIAGNESTKTGGQQRPRGSRGGDLGDAEARGKNICGRNVAATSPRGCHSAAPTYLLRQWPHASSWPSPTWGWPKAGGPPEVARPPAARPGPGGRGVPRQGGIHLQVFEAIIDEFYFYN